MIPETEYGNMIKDFIAHLTEKYVWKLNDREKKQLEGIILTGSFASWLKGKKVHHPSWKVVPDVNYYPLIKGSEEDIIYFGHILYSSINETIKELEKVRKRKYNISLDLHPFSISPTKPLFREGIINIQLTTRIINLNQKERYPDYSWFGWTTNYIILYPKEKKNVFGDFSVRHLDRDEVWLRNMYLALLSYGNILQVLPLYSLDKEHLLFEAYRYLKEIAKDGVSLALTEDEFQRGKLYEIITDWQNKIVGFYQDRYGEEAAAVIKLLVEMDKDYIYYLNTIDNPIELVKKAITLKNIIFEKGFKERLREFTSEKKLSDSVFKNLPLWW